MKDSLCRYSIMASGPDSNVNVLPCLVSAVGGTDIVCANISHQVFASLTDNMVTKLKRDGLRVARVQNVQPAVVSVPRQIVGTAEYSPGDMLDLLGLNDFKFSVDPPLTGEGFVAAVVDSGIRSTHQLIGGKVVHSENFTAAPSGDQFSHGTAVAAIIHAVVPDADILDMKVLDNMGNGTEESVVLALEACARLLDTNPDLAPNVINMSLGSPDDGNPYNPMRVACRAVMDRGIVIIAAAGNNGVVSGAITNPACERYVVAVGSMSTTTLQINEYSSRGPTIEGLIKPDAVFLGENIVVADSASDTATSSKSGTSFSTPLTTGVMVLTMEGVVRMQTIPPEMYVGRNVITSVVAIDDMLPTVCMKPEGVPAGKDNDYGYGVPVGSLIQNRTAGVGLIDINTTMALSIFFVMMQMATSMI